MPPHHTKNERERRTLMMLSTSPSSSRRRGFHDAPRNALRSRTSAVPVLGGSGAPVPAPTPAGGAGAGTSERCFDLVEVGTGTGAEEERGLEGVLSRRDIVGDECCGWRLFEIGVSSVWVSSMFEFGVSSTEPGWICG